MHSFHGTAFLRKHATTKIEERQKLLCKHNGDKATSPDLSSNAMYWLFKEKNKNDWDVILSQSEAENAVPSPIKLSRGFLACSPSTHSW